MIATAPGTVSVISRIGMPPARMASTAAKASSADAARTTGTRPTSRMRWTTFIGAIPSRSRARARSRSRGGGNRRFARPLPGRGSGRGHGRGLRASSAHSYSPAYAGGPALHHALDFGECGHARVARCRHGERAVGGAAFDGPLRAFLREKAVDQAGGEGVAAADAIEDLEIGARRRFVEGTVVPRNRAPIVDRRGVCDAECGRDDLQLRIGLAHFADHFLEGFFRQFAEVFVDAFDVEAEGDAEVFFVSEEHVDEGDELAIHGARLFGAADSLPQRRSIVQIVGNERAIFASGFNLFSRDVGSRFGKRGEDAAGVEPARAGEDGVPIDVACFQLRDGGVSAIGAAECGAHAETAL